MQDPQQQRPTRLRLAVIALSFACIALSRQWFIIAAGDGFVYPTLQPSWFGLLHPLLACAILGTGAYLLLLFARNARSGVWLVATHLLLVVLLVPSLLFLRANTNLAVHVPALSKAFYQNLLGPTGFALFTFATLAAAVGILWKWPLAISRGIAVALTLFLPFAGLQIIKLIWYLHQSDTLPTSREFASVPNHLHKVVVVVFDEFDYALYQSHRAAGARFPHLDALDRNAIASDQAYAPAIHTTATIPSYFLGKRLKNLCRLPTDDLRLTFEGQDKPVLWSEQPTWVSQSAERHIPMGLVGWYHPYCKLMGSHAKSCFALGSPYMQSPAFSAKRVGAILASAFSPGTLPISYHAQRHEIVFNQAKGALARADLKLVYLHLSVPHLPTIFDPATRSVVDDRQENEAQQKVGYLDNLHLADQALGELMATSSTQTHWIVTSDHSIHAWRWLPKDTPESQIDRRIPFWVKLAEESKPLRIRLPFNTLLLKDLSLELAEGRIRTGAEVERFIRVNASTSRHVLPAQPVDLCPHKDEMHSSSERADGSEKPHGS